MDHESKLNRGRALLLIRALILAVAVSWSPVGAIEESTPSEGEKLFALKVKPLFAEKCNACHGDEPDKLKGDLDLRSLESVLRGGDYFADEVLIPGNGEESYLYLTTTRSEPDYEMPPKEADRLTEEQGWWIRDWINAGAPWPDDERVDWIQQQYAEGEQVKTSLALSEAWQNRRYDPGHLWAYRPVEVDAVPAGEHPVDWFIDRKLGEAGLVAAPDSEARSLARRLSFGLTGLPPEPEAIESFAAAYDRDRTAAVRDFASELMGSPHYGERFGLHWLDVVRYADSSGFANDYTRPNAWRYRDYVVRAFNEDKPYDDFAREQIAGDELDPGDSEHLIATGFLRMGPWEHTAMSVFRETRQQWLDDITDSVGQTFLGHAMQCAKCHDHKFDPVPTRDYYAMMAVFSTTQFAERAAPFLEVENRSRFDVSDALVQAKVASYERDQKQLRERVAAARERDSGEVKVGDNGLDPGDEASLARVAKNIARHRWELDRTRSIAFSVYTGKTIPRNNVGGRLDLPSNPWAEGELEQDAILAGGDAYSPTDPVRPGALSAAESLGEMEAGAFPDGDGKRRAALAEWIVDPKNPLTARVMVNRVWSWHFGQGIAGNPNNLGATGGLPTHPELLDFLANWFMENGWSVKRLNLLLVTSDAYRRSAVHPDAERVAERDPKGHLYASFLPRRLTAEELRDAMLAVSGELNPEVGGIPARPDMNLEVAMQPRQIMGGVASVYEPDPRPEQRNRRTIYAEKIRGLRDPFLETFNQPGPDLSCELRETSTVAPQALTLLNGGEVHDRALAFAARLLESPGRSDAEVLESAFQTALGRLPTVDERALCLEHWAEAAREEASRTPLAMEFRSEVQRTAMAEKTGEPYTFTEFMPAYTSYQPDLQPFEADARTRALAQVCLVIFNLNEFANLD